MESLSLRDALDASQAIDQITAEESLAQMFVADWPSIKETERKKHHARIVKTANGSRKKAAPALSNAALAEILTKR